MHIYKLTRLLNSRQAATFKEDFDAQRKDRERAHSKMAEMEIQLQENFRVLESSRRSCTVESEVERNRVHVPGQDISV